MLGNCAWGGRRQKGFDPMVHIREAHCVHAVVPIREDFLYGHGTALEHVVGRDL